MSFAFWKNVCIYGWRRCTLYDTLWFCPHVYGEDAGLCDVMLGFARVFMERMLGCARTSYDMLGFARVFMKRLLGFARTSYDMLGFARVFVNVECA